jgi:hypothetical protein
VELELSRAGRSGTSALCFTCTPSILRLHNHLTFKFTYTRLGTETCSHQGRRMLRAMRARASSPFRPIYADSPTNNP